MTMTILDQQQAFAEAYVLGHGNATQAAISAGYSAVSARQTASRLLHTPHVQDAIRRAQTHALRGRLASKALGVLEKILDDDAAPAGVRLDAAKTVLDRAGLSAQRAPDANNNGDDSCLSEMTVVELEALVRQHQLSLAVVQASAHAIDATPRINESGAPGASRPDALADSPATTALAWTAD